jgi:hypothetical protein
MSGRTVSLATGGIMSLVSLGLWLKNRMIKDAERELQKLDTALEVGSCSHPAAHGQRAIIMGLLPELLYRRSVSYKEVFQWTSFLKSMLGFGSGNGVNEASAEWTQVPVSASTTIDLPLRVITTGVDGNNKPVELRLNRQASELAESYPRALTIRTREDPASSDSVVRPEGGRFTKVEELAKATALTFMARIHYSSERGWYVPAMEPIRWMSSRGLRDKMRGLKATTAMSQAPPWLYQGLGAAGLLMLLYGIFHSHD